MIDGATIAKLGVGSIGLKPLYGVGATGRNQRVGA